jgi:HD-GYP domain-containing protein (c-di-GMP phosphodiesterase class II)
VEGTAVESTGHDTMIINECLEALALVLEFNTKDFPDHQHGRRVGEGCVLIGDKLGLPADALQKMYYAGLLHDIGKISVDPHLLAKKGGLTAEEFDIIKRHTVEGSRIVATLPGLGQLALMVRWHHEWWDGTGYPDGLERDEIPLEVRVLGTIDCFDSLQTPRIDRERYSPERAYEIIEEQRGSHFDPEILDLVWEMVDERTLVPGRSSDAFLSLKDRCIDRPIASYESGSGSTTTLASLYPILRLFARVIDAKHRYTRGHSTRVSILSKYLAEAMGMSPEDIVKAEVAGLLHDAGKVSVPIEILDKPGRPDDHEWEIIQGHPGHSYEILSSISWLEDIASISASHHERYDGSGYPGHLSREDIGSLAQIVAIADTYDAITSTRSYREKQPPEVAYRIIGEHAGSQFDPEVARALLGTSPKYIAALFDMYEA